MFVGIPGIWRSAKPADRLNCFSSGNKSPLFSLTKKTFKLSIFTMLLKVRLLAFCLSLPLLCLCLVGAVVVGEAPSVKTDMPDTPITTYTPPEGNTTFLGGVTWCVANSNASPLDLQNALDWACGPGLADCSAIQPGQPCYQPNNILKVASYAFNIYYQTNGNSPIACNFGGTGTITPQDPSYEGCRFIASPNIKNSGVRNSIGRWRAVLAVGISAAMAVELVR